MPKTFGFTEDVRGLFPYFSNLKDNYGKVFNSHSPIHFYAPDSYNVEKRMKLEEYLQEVKNEEFDFDTNMRDYCVFDVNVRAVCLFIIVIFFSFEKNQPLFSELKRVGVTTYEGDVGWYVWRYCYNE
ncbi:unnamed protein product [Caenorhabditis angaria]|uniref:Uncharacterized protein n=1 Tax=Caenorhabditis angaria TaxID=860376 RepID=A0A9P1MTN9_9PELO|nr:unnamed protein product [Caenorhabditis angaria]